MGYPTTVAAGPEIMQSSRQWLLEVAVDGCDAADDLVSACVFALIPLFSALLHLQEGL